MREGVRPELFTKERYQSQFWLWSRENGTPRNSTMRWDVDEEEVARSDLIKSVLDFNNSVY